ERYLRARQGEWRSMGLDARTRIAQGPIVKTILDVAQAEDVDLIAIASHGRTGLAHLVYGSVALGVLHRTDRPVLLVGSIDDGGRESRARPLSAAAAVPARAARRTRAGRHSPCR